MSDNQVCSRCFCPADVLIYNLCRDCEEFKRSPYYVKEGQRHAFMYAPSLQHGANNEFCRVCGKPRLSDLHDGTATTADMLWTTHYEGETREL